MKPSISDALSEGISLTWKNFGRFIVPALILFFSIIVYSGVSLVASLVSEVAPIAGLVLQMVSLLLEGAFFIVSAVVLIWFLVIAFQLIRSSSEPRFSWSRVGWYLLYQVLMGVVAVIVSIPVVIVAILGGVGFSSVATSGVTASTIAFGVIGLLIILALILALIYLSVRISLVSYVIADTNVNPIDALKRSWQLSYGRFWPLVGISILSSLLNFAGVLALGIGLIFTIPAAYVMLAHYYDQLLPMKKT